MIFLDYNVKSAGKIHFVGIGGISMSALALILKNHGHEVTGSDTGDSEALIRLSNSGIKIYKTHDAKNIEGSDLVVYTAAVKDDNPELVAAKQKGICIMERCVLLGMIMKKYAHAINVSGTHGKTTTTSMLAVVLQEAGLDPTVTVGGDLLNIGGNLRLGKSPYFLTEACEYVDSFLKFFPTIAVITNIDMDHLDYFKNIEQIISSFNTFAKKLPENGLLVINGDDENCKAAVNGVCCPVKTCSLTDPFANYFADNIEYENGVASFDLFIDKKFITRVFLGVPGKHNIYNALSTLAVADFLNINMVSASEHIEKFHGTHRRFEKMGEINGAQIYDDYAHHPTEIRATLESAKNLCKGDLYCVFQPHTYTRTKALFDEFTKSFDCCKAVIITDIYAAREKDTGVICAKDLADKTKNSVYIKDFEEIARKLRSFIKDGDIVITMGAGNVFKVGQLLLS